VYKKGCFSLKNVVINKLTRYVFTEKQLRAYWKRLGEEYPFDSIKEAHLMKLAEQLYSNSSLSELKQHIVGQGWRSEDEVAGKLLANNQEQADLHVQVIDTDQAGGSHVSFLDQDACLTCTNCNFSFYIEPGNNSAADMHCPVCAGSVVSREGSRSYGVSRI
jgi:ssDNA-binding Zn-finger/Zn-ribbon topoisomerase 1